MRSKKILHDICVVELCMGLVLERAGDLDSELDVRGMSGSK